MGEIFHHCETTPCVGPNKDQRQIEVNHMINSREIQSTCCHIGCYQDLGGRNSPQKFPGGFAGFCCCGFIIWVEGKGSGGGWDCMEILTSLFFVEAVFRCFSGRYCGSSCSGKPFFCFGKKNICECFVLIGRSTSVHPKPGNLESFRNPPPQRVTKTIPPPNKKTGNPALLKYSDCPPCYIHWVNLWEGTGLKLSWWKKRGEEKNPKPPVNKKVLKPTIPL